VQDVKFTVERDVLAEAVTWTARSLPSRPSIPVLAGVRLEATSTGTLALSSFDYEVSAVSEITAEVAEPGTVLVSGRLLAEISRSLPSRPVEIVVEGTRAVLTCGSSRFTLLTMPLEDYPALPALPPASGTIDAHAFAEAVSQVTIAASRDETLPLLTGVRLEIEGDTLTLLATDRYRLAMREVAWNPATPGLSATALVRARTLSEVAKSLTSAGALSISLPSGSGSEIVGFEAGGRRTTSLLVDGDYPPVRRLFPESTTSHAVVATQSLVEAARRVALVAERNTPIRLEFSEGQVVLEAGQGEDAQASEAIESTFDGETITTAYNPGYLLDALGAVGKEFTRISFTHGTKPSVITGQTAVDSTEDSGFRYLIQPIRFAG
jgi:DNA polymerase III subunit beta